MAKAYKETKHQKEELWKDGKLLMAIPLRIVDWRKNCPLARIEVGVFKSLVKEEQLKKLKETF